MVQVHQTRYDHQLASFKARNQAPDVKRLAKELRRFFANVQRTPNPVSMNVFNKAAILDEQTFSRLCELVVKPSLWIRLGVSKPSLRHDLGVIKRFLSDYRYKPVNELSGPATNELYATNNLASSLHSQVLEKGNAEKIIAHGVERKKGAGVINFLNIMLEGRIGTGDTELYCGLLAYGLSDFCSGPHGPFYVILSDQRKNKLFIGDFPIIPEQFHLAYLVPIPLHRAVLLRALDEAVEKRLLTGQERTRIESKITTYEEFLQVRPGAFSTLQQ